MFLKWNFFLTGSFLVQSASLSAAESDILLGKSKRTTVDPEAPNIN